MYFHARAAALICICLIVNTATADTRTDCYLNAIENGDPQMTLGELRSLCAEETDEERLTESVVQTKPASFQQQIAAEQQSLDRSYGLTPHNPNYLLAYSLRNDPNTEGINPEEGRLDKQEALLQVSVKFPLWREILKTNNDLLFSYTGKSWFQAYNSALSKPFRETNYEPEIFLRHYDGIRLPLGVSIAGFDLGWNHQSNGRSEPLSRSWDRVMGRMALDVTPNLSILLRAWYRIPESEKEDDNPDIHQYMGYGDFRAIWTPNRNTFTAMLRPGTKKSGFDFTWSYPINNHFRIFTQYFNGYGESLIDYDRKVERIGIGFAINDFLQSP